jgi:RHS repeat-associated protein
VFELRDAVLADAAGNTVSLRVIGHSRIFYDGAPYVGLPLGRLGDHGLPVRTESLVFDDGFLDEQFDPADPLAVSPRPAYLDPSGATTWGAEYPDEFRALVPELAGYVHYADADVPGSPGGYYTVTGRHRYDVHDPHRVPRGLALGSLDAFGAESRVGYDEHDLLHTVAVDPVGLATVAEYDLRVLRPRRVTEPNGNTSQARFSPAGFVTAHFVSGKNGEGDSTAPSVRMDYDLLVFAERGQPVSVRSIARVHHDTDPDVPADRRNEEAISVEYSDGFGRLLQSRTQAEDVLFGDPVFGADGLPVDQTEPVPAAIGRARPAGAADNVVVSGWQVYDNKGRVVEKYEPFFASGYDFTPPVDAQLGQKATIFYDPAGRAIRTVHPDRSEELTVIGVPIDLADPDVFAPTPWESFAYDANDNAGRTHAAAAESYRDHWNTTASTEVDALGRPVTVVARNGPDPDTDWFVTRSTYDIQGNPISLIDALGREAFRYRSDLAGRRWRMDNIDAGRRDSVLDALGNPVESRDSKGAFTIGSFDILHRPIRVWARDTAAGPATLRQRIDYGDGGDPDQPASDRAAARAHNLLGRPVAHYDEAGLVTVTDVDFKGNILDSTRQIIAHAPILATYDRAAADGWQVTPFRVDWQPAPGQTADERAAALLDPVSYRTTSRFDALGRLALQILPTDVEGRRRRLRPAYNRAGGLEQLWLDDTPYVERIAYDATGQRTLIAYGNGVMTRCAYDRCTLRLARLRSERYTAEGLVYRPTGESLQDYGYDYDLVGNVVTMRDRTPESGIPGNSDALTAIDPAVGRLLIGGNALDRRFRYDPLYRLISASGRETDLAPDGPPWLDTPRGTDLTRARAYTETYRYDALGSLRRLDHGGGPGGFTRRFTVDPASNRLQRVRVGQDSYDYTFDPNGNMISETSSRHFDYNHADQLVAFRTQTGSAEPSVHAHYLYDAAGQRVKKLVRKQGGQFEVTHYLAEFEHHRWGPPSHPAEHNLIHVADDRQRIAVVRLGPPHPNDHSPAVQLQLGDHLTSSNVVVDDTATLTRREEYTPYGETSFGSFARKRYRFTGQERDQESGLAYHSARYLHPALGRFTSVDPAHENYPGWSSFCYALANPLRFTDPGGESPEEDAAAARASYDAHVKGIEGLAKDAADTADNITAQREHIKRLERMVERELPGAEGNLSGAKDTLKFLEKQAKEIPAKLRGAIEWLDKEAKELYRAGHNFEVTGLYDRAAREAAGNRVTAVKARMTDAEQRLSGLVKAKKGVTPWKSESKTTPPRGGGPQGGGGVQGGGPQGSGLGSRFVNFVKKLIPWGKKIASGAKSVISVGAKYFGLLLGAIDLAGAESTTDLLNRASRLAIGAMGAEIGIKVCAPGGPLAMAACGTLGGLIGVFAPEIAAAGRYVARKAASFGAALWKPALSLNELRALTK